MRNIVLIFIVTFSLKGNCQELELFRTWYLTKVIIENIDYFPSNYGYYPTVTLLNDQGVYVLGIADPVNISCQAPIQNFIINPNSFVIMQEWVCLPKQTCNDDPVNGPCSIIFGRHSDIYYGIITPIIYTITENNDKTFTLEISNSEGNYAVYNSQFLTIDDFSFNKIKIHPNPTTNTLFISSENLQIEQLSVFNLSGQKVMEIEEATSEIDVSTLQNGIYFLEITSEDGTTIKKFVKK